MLLEWVGEWHVTLTQSWNRCTTSFVFQKFPWWLMIIRKISLGRKNMTQPIMCLCTCFSRQDAWTKSWSAWGVDRVIKGRESYQVWQGDRGRRETYTRPDSDRESGQSNFCEACARPPRGARRQLTFINESVSFSWRLPGDKFSGEWRTNRNTPTGPAPYVCDSPPGGSPLWSTSPYMLSLSILTD